MKFHIHPWAEADLRLQIEYLEKAEVSLEVLEDFDAAVREALVKISTNPVTWSFAPGSTKIRKVQMPQFRMQVF